MESLFDQVSKGIREAMKAHDKVRLEALRNAKKVFLEAKTAPEPMIPCPMTRQ